MKDIKVVFNDGSSYFIENCNIDDLIDEIFILQENENYIEKIVIYKNNIRWFKITTKKY